MDEKDDSINAFIVPSETGVLLFLIIILPLMIMFEISGSLTWIFPEFSRIFLSAYLPVERWMANLLVVPLICLAVLISYFRLSALVRREGLVDLGREHPLVAAEIRELAKKAGLVTPLRLLYSPTQGIDIYTLGTYNDSMIVLSRGFLDTFHGKDDEFQAIIYHELAHIVSGDVGKTELAMGFLFSFFILGGAFSAMGIATIIVRFMRYGPDLGAWQTVYDPITRTSFTYIANPDVESFISNFSMNIFTLLITGVILWFLVRFILQYRELYADAMATRMMGSQKPLNRALVRLQAAAYYAGRRLGFLSRPWRSIVPGYHPSIARREAFLQQPDRFFTSWFSLPFTIGIVAATFMHILGRVQLIYNVSVPADPLLFTAIPVTCLAVALLLPKSTARLFLTPLTQLSRSHPLVVTQVFMAGFATGVMIDTNISILIQSSVQKLLYTGQNVTFSFTMEFMGMHVSAWNPAIGLIIGERYALVTGAILMISGMITTVLLQVPGWRTLFTRPSVTLLLVPGASATILYVLAATGYLLAAILLVVAGVLVLGVLVVKYHVCPVCQTRVVGTVLVNHRCPACRFDFGWWIRNPK